MSVAIVDMFHKRKSSTVKFSIEQINKLVSQSQSSFEMLAALCACVYVWVALFIILITR